MEDGQCVAINKNKPLVNEPDYKFKMRCKSRNKHGSIFCATHKRHRPDSVAIGLKINDASINPDTVNNREWVSIPYTNEPAIKLEITKYKETIESARIEKEIKDNELITAIVKCKVCCEDVENHCDLIRCSKLNPDNKHLICKECMGGHIDSLISDGIGTNTCMFDKSDKCKGDYSLADINEVLKTPEKRDQWMELVNISEITKMASICDDYVICPLCCRYGCIFEIPIGVNINFYIPCAKCEQEWCNVCKRKSHGERSCYKLEFLDEEKLEKRIEVIDHMIQELVSKTLTHCCSTCGCAYIKEEGCNLMICPKCESMSCYLCNMKLYYKNNTKYWHFAGHDLSDPDAYCQLWNNVAGDGKVNQGNLEYNDKKIRKALLKFVKENLEEPKANILPPQHLQHSICILICQRITHIFSKDKEYEDMVKMFNDMNMVFVNNVY